VKLRRSAYPKGRSALRGEKLKETTFEQELVHSKCPSSSRLTSWRRIFWAPQANEFDEPL
jgi:hypothetical protein